MAEVEVEVDEVKVRLSPLERLGAFHGDVRVPRAAIRDVRVAQQPFSERRGIRAPGTGWPGAISLGTRRRGRGKKDFVAIYRGRVAVVLELDPAAGEYERVTVSLDSPERVQRALQPQ